MKNVVGLFQATCEQKKKVMGWDRGESVPSSLPLFFFSQFFFSRSLPSRRTALSERLEHAMKIVAVLTEDGAFALFFRPHQGGFDSSRAPTPGICHPGKNKC